jgi:hypothetical protein
MVTLPEAVYGDFGNQAPTRCHLRISMQPIIGGPAMEMQSVRNDYPIVEHEPVSGEAAKKRPHGRSDGKRLLRWSNTLLLLSVLIALICVIVLYKRNAKLNQERLRLMSTIQTISGTMAGPPSAQVGDVLPSFETSSSEGARTGIR